MNVILTFHPISGLEAHVWLLQDITDSSFNFFDMIGSHWMIYVDADMHSPAHVERERERDL